MILRLAKTELVTGDFFLVRLPDNRMEAFRNQPYWVADKPGFDSLGAWIAFNRVDAAGNINNGHHVGFEDPRWVADSYTPTVELTWRDAPLRLEGVSLPMEVEQ